MKKEIEALCNLEQFGIFLYNTRSHEFMETAKEIDEKWTSLRMIPSKGHRRIVEMILNREASMGRLMEVKAAYEDWLTWPNRKIGK